MSNDNQSYQIHQFDHVFFHDGSPTTNHHQRLCTCLQKIDRVNIRSKQETNEWARALSCCSQIDTFSSCSEIWHNDFKYLFHAIVFFCDWYSERSAFALDEDFWAMSKADLTRCKVVPICFPGIPSRMRGHLCSVASCGLRLAYRVAIIAANSRITECSWQRLREYKDRGRFKGKQISEAFGSLAFWSSTQQRLIFTRWYFQELAAPDYVLLLLSWRCY